MDLLDQCTHVPASPDAGRSATAEKPRLSEVVGQRANPRVEWVEIKVKSVLNLRKDQRAGGVAARTGPAGLAARAGSMW